MPMTFTVIDADNEEQMKGSQFTNPVDLDLLRSPAAKRKIDATFRKNRYNINIAVVIPKGVSTHGTTAAMKERVTDILGPKFFDPKALRIIYGNNITSKNNHIPMTAWILAHRIGHMTMMPNGVSSHKMWQAVNEGMIPLFGQDLILGHHSEKDYDWGIECPLFLLMPYLLTMRSARMGKLTITPDFFAEMLAQHIITGKVTFLRKEHWEERIMLLGDQHPVYTTGYRNDFPSAKARIIKALNELSDHEVHAYLSRAEHLVNKALQEFMSSCMGKTMVF